MSEIFEIQVEEDHLERLTQVRKPVLAVAELIWNALDADAEKVSVILEDNALGELSSIVVEDDGHGISRREASTLFSKLGGSWKKGGKRSRGKSRILHGQEGRGRFRAFGLGRVVDWDVSYQENHVIKKFRMSMIKDRMKRIEIGDEDNSSVSTSTGVRVSVQELDRDFRSLRSESSLEELSQIFALYLRQYKDVCINYDGNRLDPSTAMEHSETYDLGSFHFEDKQYFASLEVVEWRMPTERRLFLSDAAGFPLDSILPGVKAPGFSFTAYLKSECFSKIFAENRLELAELDPNIAGLIAVAKAAMRDHFRKRSSERAAGLVAEWKKDNVYPFSGEPVSEIEVAERQVFDVVALSVNNYLPSFSEADEKTKRLQLRLLRHAIESGASDLSKILTEILELPEQKRQELAELLDKTSLSNIISASKTISDRLEFLLGLESLVFDERIKQKVHERTQLHRVVAENSWMFGEQYHLSVDDQSLTDVLKAHLNDKMEVEIGEPVLRADGRRGIVDLMFSRNIQIAGSEEREHLVVELKRPNVRIGSDALTQIESYAFAVANDARFKGVKAKWVFWAISTDMDSYASMKAGQRDRPRGMTFQSDDPSITIWVKKWSELINDCRSRLKFFSNQLGYVPDRDSSMRHLKETYSKYLSELFTAQEAESIKRDASKVT